MADCTQPISGFPAVKKRQLEVNFSGGAVSSDAGVLLVAQADRKLRLTERVAAGWKDSRRQQNRRHSLLTLLRQRVFGLALGYEDLNDHDSLRNDPLFQTALGKDQELASSPTLCRFENRITREQCVEAAKSIVEVFVESFKEPPQELILDFDSTDDRVHGEQVGRHFRGYYDHYCFLPLYVFCGPQLLVSYLRPGTANGTLHAGAILALLVRRFRQKWPTVRIIYRGDSDFMTGRILHWCERNNVDYIVGIRSYQPIKRLAQDIIAEASERYVKAQEKIVVFGEVNYQARKHEIKTAWPSQRRVLVKAECDAGESSARFVITSLAGTPKELYENRYNPRGDMENRIKEQKLMLFSDRTSCREWHANQLRLQLSSLAYVITDGIRRLALCSTDFAKLQCGSVRQKLFKVGAVVIRNTRRVRVLMSTSYPYQSIFREAFSRLLPD